MPTWRRPHLPKSRSRLDYILHSTGLSKDSFTTTWGRGDHEEITGLFRIGPRRRYRSNLKDWVFATNDFVNKAPSVIQDVILDHDKEYRSKSNIERDQYVRGRTPREYEKELEVIQTEDGIFHAHVLMIIINRLVPLQRRAQAAIIKKGKENLNRVIKEIGEKYEEIDNLPEGSAREGEVKEKLLELKNKLRNYAENVEHAKRTCIDNFYLDNMGTNRKASFATTREFKANKGVSRLVDAGEEITDKDKILNKLQDNFSVQ